MTKLTRETLRALRDEMTAALAEVAKKHAIAISVGSCSFSGASATFKVEIAADAAEGESAQSAKARDDWKRLAPMLGLQPEWLGQGVMHRGELLEIVGLMPKRPKFPVLVRRANGRELLITAEEVQLRLGKPAAAVGSIRAA